MKKVYLLIYSLRTGGAERIALNHYKYLKRIKKFYVKFVLFTDKIEFEFDDEYYSINVPATEHIIKKFFILILRVIRVKNLIKRDKPDYIISYMESANFVNLLCFHNSIITVHNYISYGIKHRMNFIVGFIYKILIKFLYNKARLIIADSNGIKEDLVNSFKINPEKIRVIHNPVDLKMIIRKSKEPIEEKKILKKSYIINVGNLTNVKDHRCIIEAYSNLSLKLKKRYNLVIIGEGILRKELEDFINSKGLNSNIYLLGRKSNPYKYIKRASLFVLSSVSEGFPTVIIEALALNVPVISFDIPSGPKEILCNKRNRLIAEDILLCNYGILVLKRDDKVLAKAMEIFFTNLNIQNLCKKNLFKRAKNFDIDYIGKKLLQIF